MPFIWLYLHKSTFQLQKDRKNLLLKYTNNHLTYVAQSFSLPLSLCVCVCVFFFCKTSVKIGCFALAPLASVNSVYLALWCVFRCLIKLLVLNKVLSDLTLCLTPVVVIYLKMSLNRRYGSTTELLIANEMLAAKFSETCILKYFVTMTNFPNTVKHQANATQDGK